jgi:hypothetical protein
MTNEQKGLLQDLCQVCNYKATSILPQWLSTDGREEVRAFLESNPEIKRSDQYRFTLDGRPVDFGPAMPLPPHPRGLDALGNGFMGWLGVEIVVLAGEKRITEDQGNPVNHNSKYVIASDSEAISSPK